MAADAGGGSDAQPDRKPVAAESVRLPEVTVTGTRLNSTAAQPTQQVQIYTAKDIDKSGQTTVTDFLNTLPTVSLTVDPASLQTGNNATGVRLHGLPLGSTLVLIDGRRVGVSAAAAFNDIFDLNNLPLAAVERIEILPQGSSAIYGSDAIAGVVNIILKKDFDGLAMSGRYGGADDTHEWGGSAAWGHSWSRGSASLLTTYQSQSELLGKERALTANADYTRFGSRDARLTVGNPGNIFSTDGTNLPGLNAPFATVPPGLRGTPSIADFTGTAGQLNKFSLFSQHALIPETQRVGLLANGTYALTDDIVVDLRLLYTHLERRQSEQPAGFLSGSQAFQSFTVSANNPFNPFGEKVGIGYFFPGVSVSRYNTDFFLPSAGITGALGGSWSWEAAAWASVERERKAESSQPNKAAVQAALDSSDPATALNPFVDGSPGSQQLVNSVLYTDDQRYESNTWSGSALVRGSPLALPAGDLTVAVGSEYDSTTFDIKDVAVAGAPTALKSPSRDSYAFYGEIRIPVLGPLVDQANDLFAVTAAERYDHFSDFGGKNTSQAGAILHPLPGLSLSGNWGEAFKAPSLYQLYATQNTFVAPIVDPLTGKTEAVTVTRGGNPNLDAETGESHSFTLGYRDGLVPGLDLSVSNWNIRLSNSIQDPNAQIVVDNAADFPGAVVRAPECVGGPPCPIVSVNNTFTNFGTIKVAGIDYLLSYRFPFYGIQWRPEVSTTYTYQYDVAFQPGQPATDRVSRANDDGNWAPRWKGRLGLEASRDRWSGWLAGRFTGTYRDYDRLLNGTYLTLGDIWYMDASLKYRLGTVVGDHPWSPKFTVEIGAVNLLDQEPQFSNQFHGAYGFDTLQADMRGRFGYVEIHAEW